MPRILVSVLALAALGVALGLVAVPRAAADSNLISTHGLAPIRVCTITVGSGAPGANAVNPDNSAQSPENEALAEIPAQPSISADADAHQVLCGNGASQIVPMAPPPPIMGTGVPQRAQVAQLRAG